MSSVRATRPWKQSVSTYKAARIAELSLRTLPITTTDQEEFELRRSAARKRAWDNRFQR